MAERFAADLDEAADVAKQLRDVRADLYGMSAGVGDAVGVTGSATVAGALQHFIRNTSDNREKLGQLLDRAAGLLESLVQGAASADQTLTNSLGTGSAP